MIAKAKEIDIDPMFVLHVLLKTGVGGLERLLSEFLPRYKAEEHGILVLRKKGELHEHLRRECSHMYEPLHRLRLLNDWRAIRIIYLHRRNIIHLHHTGPRWVLLCWMAGCRKIIYHVHGTSLGTSSTARIRNKLLWRIARNCVHTYVAQSINLRQILVERSFPSDNIRVIYNGVDFDGLSAVSDSNGLRRSLDIPEDACIVAYLGRFTKGKNPYKWLDVARELLRHNPDIRFIMAGDGPELAQAKLYAEMHGL